MNTLIVILGVLSSLCFLGAYLLCNQKRKELMDMSSQDEMHIRKLQKEKQRLFQRACEWEIRAYVGGKTRQRWKDQGHPRGMLGKKHTREALEKISVSSKIFNDGLTQEQKAIYALKGVKTKLKNGTLYRERNASWKAGWREIGNQRKYFRSTWEANYARYLEWLRENGKIRAWEHEPDTFYFEGVKRGTVSYLPDFKVTENDGTFAYHEVKGWMDDRSKTKIRRMAKYHPHIKLIVITSKEYSAVKKAVMALLPDWETNKKGN